MHSLRFKIHYIWETLHYLETAEVSTTWLCSLLQRQVENLINIAFETVYFLKT